MHMVIRLPEALREEFVFSLLQSFRFKPMNLLAGFETAAQKTIPVDLEAAE